MRWKHGEATAGDELLEFRALDHAGKKNIRQLQIAGQRLQPLSLGTLSRNHEGYMGQSRHGMQKLVQAFLGGKPPEVEDVAFLGDETFLRGQSLKMRQHFNLLGGETSADQLGANKFGGREKHGRRARPHVTVFRDRVKVIAPEAQFARSSMRHEIVVRTQDLEVVQVIDNGDALSLQFPQNRRRQVMIDSANVGQIRRVVAEAGTHAAPGGGRIERVCRHPSLLQKTGVWILEIEIRNQVAPAGERRGASVVHAEQGSVVAALVYAAYQFEEIGFGAAKQVVVLVAVKNSHIETPVGRYESGTGPQTGGDSAVGHN